MNGFKHLNTVLIYMQYSAGSNTGDLYWIWQCRATNIDDALKSCQPIIKKLKKDISEHLPSLVSPRTKILQY